MLHCLETWYLRVREEHSLTVFENMVLRIISSSKGRVTGGWQKPNCEELQNVHSSSQIVKSDEITEDEMDWARSTSAGE